MLAFLKWLQETSLFSHLRDSAYAYPVLLWLHMMALAFLGGMIILTDLRLLGIAIKSYSISEVVNGLRGFKRFGFIVAALTGGLMFGAKAEQYSHNPWFWFKIALLVLIAGNYLLFRRSLVTPKARNAKLAAVLSLLLWTGVVCAARGPATIKDIMHSMVDPSGDFLFKSVQKIADDHGVREKAPQTDAEWNDVRLRVAVLLEAPDLLTANGRMAAHPKDRSRNPEIENEPAQVQELLDADRASFVRRARRLRDAAAVAMKAVDARDKDGLFNALDGIDKACESCHLHYWYPNDKRAQEAAKEDGITE